MRIQFASIMVPDQEKALQFYTDVLGLEKMADIRMGEYRWLTVRSPEKPDGMELVLEPMSFAPSGVYQKDLFEAGIPATALITSDIQKDYKQLRERGVKFHSEPAKMGPITSVLFEDTCGNLINLVQPQS